MNLTELQTEIRKVEKQLSTICTEIDKLKPNNEEEKIDFDYITQLAKMHPIARPKLKAAPYIIKNDFIKGLSYLFLNGERNAYEGLLYITRVAVGIDLQISSRKIYMDGLSFNKKDLYNICNNIGEYKYSFLTEAFIVANLCEEYAVSKLSAAAEFSEILGCDKEDVYVISHIAKSKLTGDLSVLNDITLQNRDKYSDKFEDYISDWLEYKRKECAKLCIGIKDPYIKQNLSSWFYPKNSSSEPNVPLCTVEEEKENGAVVEKGDVILKYKEDDGAVKEVVSEFDGILFYINDSETKDDMQYTYLYAYVVSNLDNYEDFKRWFDLKKILGEQ